jgi:hypothetical protein
MPQLETSRSEKEVFDDLDVLCGSPGYIHVLAYLSFRDNIILYNDQMTSEDMAASYAPERTIRTEFSTLMGLMLKHPIDFSIPAWSDIEVLVTRTQDLLAELHACLNRPMFEGIKQQVAALQAGLPIDDASLFQRGEVLREPIFYGGESAYSFQYRDFALDRYVQDDDWLYANKGFRIADGHAVASALIRLHSRKLLKTIEDMQDQDPSQWTVLPGFTSSLDEIVAESCVLPESASAVLAALTAPEPATNAGFLSLGDFNLQCSPYPAVTIGRLYLPGDIWRCGSLV